MKEYSVTILSSNGMKERMLARLDKYFRKRCQSITVLPSGDKEVVLRNQTKIRLKALNGLGSYREPIVEMHVTSTEDYIERSIRAVRTYASNQQVVIDVVVHQKVETPPKRKKLSPDASL